MHRFLILLSFAAKVVLGCIPCGRDGIFLDAIQPTSSPNILAAQLAFYYSLDEFSDSGPLEPFDATIDLETGQMTEGHPTGVEIYPSGLARSEPPNDFSEFTLVINQEKVTATLFDPTTGQYTTFDLPGANPSDIDFTYGWFVSDKFKLAYVFYTGGGPDEEGVAFVPVMGRPGPVTYSDFRSNSRFGIFDGDPQDSLIPAYDDLQIFQAIAPPGSCFTYETFFYSDKLLEERLTMTDMGSRETAIVYGATIDDTVVYKARNGHACRDVGPSPDLYLIATDLTTGTWNRINLTLFEIPCPAVGCCDEDCCGVATEWDGLKCVENIYSLGWDGQRPDDHVDGCAVRRCCEDACCGEGTYYYEPIKSCLGPP